MQFHNYGAIAPLDFKGNSTEYLLSLMKTPSISREDRMDTVRSCFELGWLRADRPFYNVYPIAIELCQKTNLNMKWGDLAFPSRYLLFRFPAGHEPLYAHTALLRVPSKESARNFVDAHKSRMEDCERVARLPLGGKVPCAKPGRVNLWEYESKDIYDTDVMKTAEDAKKAFVDDHDKGLATDNGIIEFLVRLVAFAGLLARGTDLITPAILAADREEYDATSDEARRRWLEERAARRQGRGFDIGRSMEIERATSPHWRCSHIALFHTGPGRAVPVLKVRSGCVVVPKDMSHVPTGYLGPEKEGEEHKELPAVFRTPIPSRMRFQVLRRDGYRCRLCGMTAEDGITLECDHIIAVAKSGKTDPLNLWTLCRPCNNGKSDSDLHLALEENVAMEKARKEVKRGIRV